MTRPNRPRAAAVKLSETAWRYLCDQPPPDDLLDGEGAELWSLGANNAIFAPDGRTTGELWHEHGRDVLVWWVEQRPGTRPRCWWRFDAPCPRQRVGGVGVPCHERLANLPSYEYGVPTAWITQRDLDIFEYIGRPLGVPAGDPSNPPTYESQAAYLLRLRLLLPGELERLGRGAFQPELIDIAEEG